MDWLLYLFGIALVAVTLFVAVRYALVHFSGTYSAWGKTHYDALSENDNGDS